MDEGLGWKIIRFEPAFKLKDAIMIVKEFGFAGDYNFHQSYKFNLKKINESANRILFAILNTYNHCKKIQIYEKMKHSHSFVNNLLILLGNFFSQL